MKDNIRKFIHIYCGIRRKLGWISDHGSYIRNFKYKQLRGKESLKKIRSSYIRNLVAKRKPGKKEKKVSLKLPISCCDDNSLTIEFRK